MKTQSRHPADRSHTANQRPVLAWRVCAFCLLLAALLIWADGANANVRVNQDPPGNVQNTESITLDQTTGNRIVGYNDIPGGTNGVGASYWTPGTGVWLDSSFPAFGWYGWEMDPSVAADQGGFVYLSQVTYDQPIPNNTRSGLYVSRSNDGGASFGAPIQVFNYPQPLPRAVKPKIEVDDFVHPPGNYDGNVYMIWQEDQINPIASAARFARSTNYGVSWTTLANPIDDNQGRGSVIWPDLAVGTDGSIAAAWLDKPNYLTQHQGQIWVDRSVDGGQSFGTDVAATTFWSVPQWLTDGNGIPKVPATSYASIEIDPSNPNRIGVVYAADPDDGAACETRIDFGDIPPGSADATLLSPFHGGSSISCNRAAPNYVYSVWCDNRYGSSEVFFSRGQIGGVYGIATWTGDTQLSTQPYYSHNASNASVVSNGPNVYVTWCEWAGVDFANLIFFNRSTDYGQTWLGQAVPVDTQPQVTYAGPPSISCDGANVCIAWEVGRSGGTTEIRCNYSTNTGNTWQANDILIRAATQATTPQIAQAGGRVFCVWAEAFGVNGSDIYASLSTDYGQTWSGPSRLNFNDPVGASFSWGPKICCTPSGHAYAVWEDKRVNNIDNPYFAHTYNGINWQGDIRLNTGMAAGMSRDFMTQIACASDYPAYVAVVYQSDRAALGSASDIYMNCSIDGGLTWFPADAYLCQGRVGGSAQAVCPRVSIYDYGYPNQAYFYATWMEDRNSSTPFTGWDVYATHADYNPMSGGWTWLNSDYRIDVGDQPAANDSWYPHVASDHTGPYYAWRDERNGQGDVYANQYRTGPDEGDIFYIESTDAGATWRTPIRVNDDVGTNDQALPWLDIKPNGIVDVVWYDWRADPMDHNAEFYMATLLPGATTFNANVVVTNQQIVIPPQGNWTLGDYTWVAVDTTQAHCVWADTRRGGDNQFGDAFYNAMANPSFGACCYPGGTCVMQLASACTNAGGNFMGNGTDCDPNPCGEPVLWLNHNVGQPTLTMTCQGILGFMDGTQSEGSGFIYPSDGVNHLFLGGLWVGLEADYVANRDYDADPDREWTVSVPDGYIQVDESGWISGDGVSDQDVHSAFTDAGVLASRGLSVEQTSWAYRGPEPADDFVIINYDVVNESPATLEDVYVGLFMDFDIDPDGLDDEGMTDPAAGIAYLYDASGIHTGIVLLQPEGDPVPVASVTLVDNETFVWPNQYILDADKDAFLRASDPGHVLYASPAPNDYSLLASAGPFVLDPDEGTRVSFAVVGGTSLEHFNGNALAAQLTFMRGISGTSGPATDRITAVRLLPNRPNPFPSTTNLFFELPDEREVRMSVYDVAGRRVRQLLDGHRPAGQHVVRWDGQDDAGRTVAEGVYFVRLRTGRTNASRPILLLR